MREIKFRAWDKEEKKFKFFHLHHSHSICTDLSIPSKGQWEHLEEFEQFIGLKDKNGEEIYEGDILKNLDANIPNTVIIGWRNHNASFGTNGWDLPFNLEKIYEVVSNVHEYKEVKKKDGKKQNN